MLTITQGPVRPPCDRIRRLLVAPHRSADVGGQVELRQRGEVDQVRVLGEALGYVHVGGICANKKKI